MAYIELISDMEDSGLSLPDSERVRRYAAYILEHKNINDYEVNIVFVDDDTMTRLNETYKHRVGTTDVLSFNLSDNPDEMLEGEIYISLPQAGKQAEDRILTAEEEIIRLITHGLLHLSGYTHNTKEDLSAMIDETERFVAEFFERGGHR